MRIAVDKSHRAITDDGSELISSSAFADILNRDDDRIVEHNEFTDFDDHDSEDLKATANDVGQLCGQIADWIVAVKDGVNDRAQAAPRGTIIFKILFWYRCNSS